ncbi:hypothetical protein C0992_008317 [Termitomyces sp. T32_za158]|nr:hypothetical protein C0992_008317 [Termitomyces sp. T32_za158]
MPPTKSEVWQFFLPGAKQNGSHLRAHCLGCLEKCRPNGEVVELDGHGFPKSLSSDSWVKEACNDDIGGVLGVKESMIAHILGKNGVNPCPNTSTQARKMAKALKEGRRKRSKDEVSENQSDDEEGRKPKKLLTKVETSMKQSQLKVFHGINVPFTPEQEEIIQKQFLCATISANLPFQWVEDPEVLKLFLLFRSTAGDVIPSRKQVSGQLLDQANDMVTDQLKTFLRGKYAVLTSDGWKDESRNAVTGVNLSVNGKTYLVDLILANAHKKDGDAMCRAFEAMIDKAEEVYGVYIVALCCDNNGGSQRGRKNVVLNRQWLFGPPCCAHQFQLTVGDYFVENKEAAMAAEKATDLIGWILNHGLVRSIFNNSQLKNSGKVLMFLVANMTRWNTHFVAFDRLQDLKPSLQLEVLTRRNDIIAAQVGAEKNQRKKKKLMDDAIKHCDLIEDGGFWRELKAVVNDLEPICFGLNMNQTDLVRPDQTYRRVRSRPPKDPRTDIEEEKYEEEKLRKEKEVSEAFFSYLSGRGPFEDWEKNKKTFQEVNGNDPLAMWTAFLPVASIAELADFAMLLLGISVNQAGLERNFSDLKIKKI